MLSVNDIAQFTLLLKNQIRLWRAVHKTTTYIHLGTENIQQISQAPRETPFDIYGWNIVSTMSNTLGNPQFRHLHAGQRQIDHFSIASGDKPAAIKSTLTKREFCATCGSHSSAKVVLPAPLGPAIIRQIGISSLTEAVRHYRPSCSNESIEDYLYPFKYAGNQRQIAGKPSRMARRSRLETIYGVTPR